MAKIKIGNNRVIELLSAKKNPSEKHIKIGNYFGELTTDISKTNGKPTLKLSKDGKNYYIREKFTVDITNKTLYSSNLYLYDSRDQNVNLSFGGKVIKGTLTITASSPSINRIWCYPFGSGNGTLINGTATFNIPAGTSNGVVAFRSGSGNGQSTITIKMTATLEG